MTDEAVNGGYTPRRIVVAYVAVNGLFTLSASLIWAINTIFLLREGGLDLFQVMIVNSAFTLGSLVFEVPTGVVADTIGRRASILLSMAVLFVSTVLYVLSARLDWGVGGFLVASAALGLGFTFQTGATDAWLVDALDATGYVGEKDRVFAFGQQAVWAGMLVGSILGGVLGQIDLAWPFLVRAGLLVATFFATLALVRDAGFTPRPLRVSTFGEETRRIFRAGVTFGWNSPVVRPLMWASGVTGLFFMYSFYAWQPYVLGMLGKNAVWLLGVVTAGFAGAGIAGNALVGRVMNPAAGRREPARVMMWLALAEALIAAAIAAVGLLKPTPGPAPAAAIIALWLMWGFTYGVQSPIRMAFLNAQIPSAERATVLSLDAFFADGGGVVGQPALGWVSKRFSIALAWMIGAAGLSVAVPLYARVRRAGDTVTLGDSAGGAVHISSDASH